MTGLPSPKPIFHFLLHFVSHFNLTWKVVSTKQCRFPLQSMGKQAQPNNMPVWCTSFTSSLTMPRCWPRFHSYTWVCHQACHAIHSWCAWWAQASKPANWPQPTTSFFPKTTECTLNNLSIKHGVRSFIPELWRTVFNADVFLDNWVC